MDSKSGRPVSPTTIEILSAGLDDVADICDLDYQAFPDESFNETTVATQLTVGGGLLARRGDEPVGYALLGMGDGLTDLLRLGVACGWRRAGIGRALLNKVCERYPLVMLCVRKDNGQAISLYRSSGFQIIGETEQGSGYKAWVMTKTS